jgi:hypothetical protein
VGVVSWSCDLRGHLCGEGERKSDEEEGSSVIGVRLKLISPMDMVMFIGRAVVSAAMVMSLVSVVFCYFLA